MAIFSSRPISANFLWRARFYTTTDCRYTVKKIPDLSGLVGIVDSITIFKPAAPFGHRNNSFYLLSSVKDIHLRQL